MASSFTSEQKAGLEASMAAFNKATEARDAMAIIGFMPPAMITKLAASENASEEATRKALAEKLTSLSDQVNKAELAVDMAKATEGTVADGTAYAIVPTKLHFELKDGTNIRTRAKTFAFEQGGHWYLLALTDVHIKQEFYDAYPQFKAVDIPLTHISQGN